MKPICSVENCDNPNKAKGLCEMHYMRNRRNGNPLDVRRPSVRDFAGQRFNKLTAICSVNIGKIGRWWQCRCDCGNIKFASAGHLHLGKGGIKSCGCANWLGPTKHGATKNGIKTSEYRIWTSMIQRCENPNDKGYPRWGGRGITICPSWRASFSTFLSDVGPRPTTNHSIDRINNDGNYEPGNCRWATAREQRLNQRPRRKVIRATTRQRHF